MGGAYSRPGTTVKSRGDNRRENYYATGWPAGRTPGVWELGLIWFGHTCGHARAHRKRRGG